MPGQRNTFNGTGDYNEVKYRIAEFRTKHPEGSLQPANPIEPFRVVEVAGQVFIAYTAAAYRTPDDLRPGIGCAWEPFPGKTNFTRDSELQNAETSAWGRAIMAALAADASKGVASAEEVRNRQADRSEQVAADASKSDPVTDARKRVAALGKQLGWTIPQVNEDFASENGGLTIPSASVEQLTSYAEDLAARLQSVPS